MFPVAFPPKKDPVVIVKEAGWVPGLVRQGVENLVLPPGFDPRTVQLITSSSTNYAIPAHTTTVYIIIVIIIIIVVVLYVTYIIYFS